MIKLDRWESQLVWYSKGWLGGYTRDNELPSVELDDALRFFMGRKAGMRAEYISLRLVAGYLYDLVEKCHCLEKTVPFSFVEAIAPQARYYSDLSYNNNKGFYSKVCTVSLDKYLSNLVAEDMDLQPFEPELFLWKE